ncbi:MAG TPA: DUF1223 domain-containing protein [Casimicrobiaceae bacterium]|jgi:hypothetical protein
MHPFLRAIGAALLILAPAVTAYADCRARSPEHSTALIELYTSEGCDSCPPADRWLSSLPAQNLGDRAVALALHVDYWDRLGWKDRFGRASFSERQRDESARSGGAFVYTPQVLLQGRDYPQWHAGDELEHAIAKINARPARAVLDLVAHPRAATAEVDVSVRVTDVRERAGAVVAVALVQNGLSSEVKAGENAGKHLRHDHVVRQWRELLTLDASGVGAGKLDLALPADLGPLSVVVLAENPRTGEVLQALEMPLCTAR